MSDDKLTEVIIECLPTSGYFTGENVVQHWTDLHFNTTSPATVKLRIKMGIPLLAEGMDEWMAAERVKVHERLRQLEAEGRITSGANGDRWRWLR